MLIDSLPPWSAVLVDGPGLRIMGSGRNAGPEPVPGIPHLPPPEALLLVHLLLQGLTFLLGSSSPFISPGSAAVTPRGHPSFFGQLEDSCGCPSGACSLQSGSCFTVSVFSRELREKCRWPG